MISISRISEVRPSLQVPQDVRGLAAPDGARHHALRPLVTPAAIRQIMRMTIIIIIIIMIMIIIIIIILSTTIVVVVVVVVIIMVIMIVISNTDSNDDDNDKKNSSTMHYGRWLSLLSLLVLSLLL